MPTPTVRLEPMTDAQYAAYRERAEESYAEDYHQQYLYKVPHGYDCHAETGILLPAL